MKKYFTAFQMTQSMFCSLPFPCRSWKEESRPYMMLFLPVIGLEIGALWVALDGIFRYFQVASPINGFFMAVLPYLLTGFMHLDGFMDVTDAVGSWRDLERRREILKDSHVGSFAVVWCVFLMLAGFAGFSSISGETIHWILWIIPVLSRCLSALAVITGKPMSTSQYAKVTYPGWHQGALVCMILGCLAVGVLLTGWTALVLLGELIAYGIAWKRSTGSLQGMNGDISGYCICISELCAVLVLAFL